MNPAVSIIIPVYKIISSQLQRCLNVLMYQPFTDIEILIINDGSPSLSEEDFLEIAALDSRIRVIHQENKGVSAARNTGITNAKGDYIAFVDADDEITKNFIIEAFSIADKYKAEIVIGTVQYVNDNVAEQIDEDDTEYVFDINNLKDLRRSQLNIYPRTLPYTMLGSPCARLIKTSLLNDVRFHENINIFEDQIFNRELLLKTKKAVYIHHIWYQYYQYDGSSFHTAKAKMGDKGLRLNLDYLEQWNKLNLKEPDQPTKQYLLQNSIKTCFASVNYWIVQQERNSPDKKEPNFIYDKLQMSQVLKNCNYKAINNKLVRLLYVLLKYKQFGIIEMILFIYNTHHSSNVSSTLID